MLTTSEKELLGLVWAVKSYRCYLYLRKFIVYIDQAAVKWLLSLKYPSSSLMKWSITLSEYNYEILHKPSKKHTNADGLS